MSYRDLKRMLGERGVSVDHSTIYRWVGKQTVINTDEVPTYTAALAELKKGGKCPQGPAATGQVSEHHH